MSVPGQGIAQGHGHEVRARSPGRPRVWDSARESPEEPGLLGAARGAWSHPTSLIAAGVHYQHPDGVLLPDPVHPGRDGDGRGGSGRRDARGGHFVEDAITCGHSVGEYTALASVSGVYELEALLEVVFHRGSKMHDIVPRDERGRSNYRLAAIRPSQIDLADADVPAFIDEIARNTGEFLQIVNFNLPRLAVRDRGHGARPGGAGGRGRASPRNHRWQAVVHSGARHRRAVPLVGAARGGRPSSGGRWNA